jgi:oligoendopeptidase F
MTSSCSAGRRLYEHPQATAAELREATGTIARATWDKYYAPVLGGRGETSLLGIYSHTIASPLYLFNYVLGHTIAFQIEEHLHGKDRKTFAAEFTRAARFGALLPDTWMVNATGKPVSSESLLAAAQRR